MLSSFGLETVDNIRNRMPVFFLYNLFQIASTFLFHYHYYKFQLTEILKIGCKSLSLSLYIDIYKYMYDFLIIDITQMNFVARKDSTLEHCWIVQALFY